MRTERLLSLQPGVTWVPSLHAFVHARLRLGVDGAEVEDDLATAIAAGDIADDAPGIAALCAEYVDLSARVFPVALDAHGRWQRVEE